MATGVEILVGFGVSGMRPIVGGYGSGKCGRDGTRGRPAPAPARSSRLVAGTLTHLAWLQWLRAAGVVLAAGEAAVQPGDEEHAIAMTLTEGAGAHLTEGGSFGATGVALMPGAFPAACNTGRAGR